jgi:hypothetical protein
MVWRAARLPKNRPLSHPLEQRQRQLQWKRPFPRLQFRMALTRAGLSLLSYIDALGSSLFHDLAKITKM